MMGLKFTSKRRSRSRRIIIWAFYLAQGRLTCSPESYLASSPTYMCPPLLVNTSPAPSSLSPIVTKSHSSYTSSSCCVRRSTFCTQKKKPIARNQLGRFLLGGCQYCFARWLSLGAFSGFVSAKMQVREFQPVGHVQLPAEHEILRDFPHFEGGSFFFPLTLKTITYEDQHRQNQFLTTYALQWRSLKEIRNSTARLTALEIKCIIAWCCSV